MQTQDETLPPLTSYRQYGAGADAGCNITGSETSGDPSVQKRDHSQGDARAGISYQGRTQGRKQFAQQQKKPGSCCAERGESDGDAVTAPSKRPAEEAARQARWQRYDTSKSPFLDLQNPLTPWYGTLKVQQHTQVCSG